MKEAKKREKIHEEKGAKLKKILDLYTYRVSEYNERLNALEPYLSKYLHSIPLRKHFSISEIKKELNQHIINCNEIAELIASREVDSYDEALSWLHSMVSHEFSKGLARGWGNKLENLIQEVGAEVYYASSKAGSSSYKQNYRRATLHNLEVAKVFIPREECSYKYAN